jgi:NTE family protein
LDKVSVLSSVSGGSVIAALYAYNDDPFDAFERRVEAVLRRGLVWGIVRQVFFSPEALKIAAAMLVAGFIAVIGRLLQLLGVVLGLVGIAQPLLPAFTVKVLDFLPRFASRTTAFERHLARRYFGATRMDEVARTGLSVVINATELRTESAFRFGSTESGCWRFGLLTSVPRVAAAVAASAAFPAFLPAIDRRMEFEKDGLRSMQRTIITDGGVYDNFGITCMLPGRLSEFSINALPVDFIIACDAGPGIPTGARRPYFWASRMMATVVTIHRRTQTMSQSLLHLLNQSGEIAGFIMPYLGQNDAKLPYRPTDLVPREEAFGYPTDFNSMSKLNIEKLSARGEQLTRCLLDAYASDI